MALLARSVSACFRWCHPSIQVLVQTNPFEFVIGKHTLPTRTAFNSHRRTAMLRSVFLDWLKCDIPWDHLITAACDDRANLALLRDDHQLRHASRVKLSIP